eukprot:757248-Rhodomonas_salina.3
MSVKKRMRRARPLLLPSSASVPNASRPTVIPAHKRTSHHITSSDSARRDVCRADEAVTCGERGASVLPDGVACLAVPDANVSAAL